MCPVYSLDGWVVMLYVPSTARSFRDGTPFTVDVELGFYTVPTGNGCPFHYHCTTPAPPVYIVMI